MRKTLLGGFGNGGRLIANPYENNKTKIKKKKRNWDKGYNIKWYFFVRVFNISLKNKSNIYIFI